MKPTVKTVRAKHVKSILFIFVLFSFGFFAQAQTEDLENVIAEHRKGEIIIKAKPGAKIRVEQQDHEFWFGCAISDGIFNGKASENDVKMYKEKFLENFNSAVTENAVKWPGMEPQKGEVDYSLVDAMLEWTGENNIPLRAHNLFWGIERFIQPWVKELSDKELEATLKNRAETVTARYKGRFAEYDLNNEMIHGNYYEDRLGADITKKMALWAQEGDPNIKLYLNDYDISHCRNRCPGAPPCRIVRSRRTETFTRLAGTIQPTRKSYRIQFARATLKILSKPRFKNDCRRRTAKGERLGGLLPHLFCPSGG